MADELDKLELQLIAYLDGELSPADVLALEQKLAAYPQHRGLMEELRQQRDLLVGLPSDAAPGALKSQLRSQVEQAGERGLSHRRLYRIAASILLMLGAGIVVHQLLPQRGDEAPQYATRMEAPTAVAMDLGDKEALAAKADYRLDSKLEAGKSDAVAGVALAQAQSRQMFANASNNGRTIINVATDNPTVLQAEIGRLLRDNRISYSQETEIPAEVAIASPALVATDGVGAAGGGRASKSEGPSPGRGSADLSRAKAKDADLGLTAKAAARPAAEASDRALADTEKQRDFPFRGGPAGAKPAPPAAPAVAAAPAPNAAAPVAQAAGDRRLQNSPSQQQVFVARNVNSGDVAQIEQALRQRQVGQKLNYRVTDTSNSQMAGPAPIIGRITGLNVATTQPVQAMLPSTTTPVQAKGGGQAPAGMPAAQQPAAQQVQQADQTMDLLIVVEPENK